MASFSIKERLEKAKKLSGYERLERREKLFIGGGVAVLLLVLIFNLVVSPMMDQRKRTQRAIVNRELDLKTMKVLQEEYKQLANKVGGIAERLEQRPPEFTLFSFLEGQATSAQVRELVKYMKPSTEEGEGLLQNSVVEMKLEKVSLSKLVEFLSLIESPENVVSINRISIQENSQGEGLLDVVMQIVTFMKKN
jgi:general secretion pathway protein M